MGNTPNRAYPWPEGVDPFVVAADLREALEAVDLDVEAVENAQGGGLAAHLADAEAAHPASAISYAGSTNLASNNVEAALDELDAEKAAAGAVTPRFLAVLAVAANQVLTDAHDVVLVDASGGARTITLPDAAGRTGRVYYIKKVDATANAVIIDGDGADTVDGQATHSITTSLESRTVVSDGANWRII